MINALTVIMNAKDLLLVMAAKHTVDEATEKENICSRTPMPRELKYLMENTV